MGSRIIVVCSAGCAAATRCHQLHPAARGLLGAGGLELSFLAAIDFTASNGDPRDPASLHFASQRPTIYEGVGMA